MDASHFYPTCTPGPKSAVIKIYIVCVCVCVCVCRIEWKLNFKELYQDCIQLPGGSNHKESAYNAGDLSLIPEPGRSPGEGHGNPL